jgi:hypothetical protein
MTRRPVLPGASELFRRTDAPSVPEVTELPSLSTTTSSPALRGGSAGRRAEESTEQPPLTLVPGGAADQVPSFRAVPQPTMQPVVATRGRPARRPDRTKHDEKITVYISADELLALETARLALRGQHGVAADRGRIVREAIAVVLADLGERGDDSVLVRRLRGE